MRMVLVVRKLIDHPCPGEAKPTFSLGHGFAASTLQTASGFRSQVKHQGPVFEWVAHGQQMRYGICWRMCRGFGFGGCRGTCLSF